MHQILSESLSVHALIWSTLHRCTITIQSLSELNRSEVHVYLLCKFNYAWKLVACNELRDLLNSDVTLQVVTTFVKLLNSTRIHVYT